MYRITLAACVLMSACSGCASIMCGDDKTISIVSDPPGARFEVESRSGVVILKDETPQTVTLNRGGGWFKQAGYLIHFEKEGYEPLTTTVNQELETGWYLGNLISFLGAPVGLVIVDPLTGAMWTIEDVNVKLTPQAVVETPAGPRRVTGYEAHINPATGEMETVPVYEQSKK